MRTYCNPAVLETLFSKFLSALGRWKCRHAVITIKRTTTSEDQVDYRSLANCIKRHIAAQQARFEKSIVPTQYAAAWTEDGSQAQAEEVGHGPRDCSLVYQYHPVPEDLNATMRLPLNTSSKPFLR